MKLPNRNLPGQTLVIILLGTTVALTVALGVSVRTISSLRQTTTTAQAQAALAAAEAGAEIGLARLQSLAAADAPCKTPSGCTSIGDAGADALGYVTLANANTQYFYSISQVGQGTEAYLLDLAKDTTQEIKLDGYASGSVKVCWYDPGLDGNPEVDNALELIYVDGSGNLAKRAFNGKVSLAANGFAAPPGSGAVSLFGRSLSFSHCTGVSLSGTPKILRLKAFYGNVSAAIEPQGGAVLGAQGYRIESSGRTLDGLVKKKVRVTKSLPALPGIFDYGLFSGSTTQPLSK